MLDPVIQSLIQLGIGGCMAAVVVWHVWFTQTKQIPSLLTTFAAQMDLTRKQGDENAKQERDSHDRLLKSEREISQMRHEENLRQSALMISSLRETHHAIKNLANNVHLHRATIDAVMRLKDPAFSVPELEGNHTDDGDDHG